MMTWPDGLLAMAFLCGYGYLWGSGFCPGVTTSAAIGPVMPMIAAGAVTGPVWLKA